MSDVLREALRPETVRLDLRSDAKQPLIGEMLDILDEAGLLADRARAEQDVLQREQELSTGISDGVALPHARTDGVNQLSAAVALKPGGVDFEALDGRPSEIFVLALLPERAADKHLDFMSAISRRLQDSTVRQNVIKSKTPEDLVAQLVNV